jgi:hypothetical protein
MIRRISYRNIEGIRGSLAFWFADTAYQVIVNSMLSTIAGETYDELRRIAINAQQLIDVEEYSKRKHLFASISLKGSERVEKIGVREAMWIIEQGIEFFGRPPPELFIEYGEYLEGFLNAGMLKRQHIFVSDVVVSLAVLGAALSHSYSITVNNERFHGYASYKGLWRVEDPQRRHELAREICDVIGRMAIASSRGVGEKSSPDAMVLAAASLIRRRGVYVEPTDILEIIELTKRAKKSGITMYRVSHISSVVSKIDSGFAGGFLELARFYGDKAVKRAVDFIAREMLRYVSSLSRINIYNILKLIRSEAFSEEIARTVGRNRWREIDNAITEWVKNL